MPKAYAKVWIGGNDLADQDADGQCINNFTDHCAGAIVHSTYDKWFWDCWCNQTMARCTGICGSQIQYASGRIGLPCETANKVRHINPGENLNGDAKGVVECTFNTVTDSTLKTLYAKDNVKNSTSTSTLGSVYDQLLIGGRFGSYNTEGQGYCENSNNLQKDVGGGKTCYDILLAKVGQTTAKQQGIAYCNNPANKTDPRCKCINVSGSGFAERCKSNPNWAGCSEINAAADGYANVGILQTLSGLTGGADCLVPGICSGDVYAPLEPPQSCANQIAICDQVQKINVNKLAEAAKLSAFQSCKIDFTKSPGTSPTPSNSSNSLLSKLSASLSNFIPVSLDQLKTDRNKQYGVGGSSFVSFSSSVLSCVIIILIIVLSGDSKQQRFRK